MTPWVQQLFPSPDQKTALKGLYLNHAIHKLGSPTEPFVYANFLSSLDGRISLIDSENSRPYLPKNLTNANDYRLFLELHAQADCLITHGGYLRAMMKGTLGNILQSGTTKETKDLADWRKRQGIKKQPAIVIASASLDFPIPPSIAEYNQPCYIATGRNADSERVCHWEKLGYPVIFAGQDRMVEGGPLVEALAKQGFGRLYLIAGPHILDTMLRDNQLSRLYQTLSLQLLGGESFHTMIPGPPLGRTGQMRLNQLYYDPNSQNACGQLFARFETAKTHG